MKRLTLADLDSIIYIVAYNHIDTTDPQEVIDATIKFVDKIIENTEAEAFAGYYQKEGHKNYRNKIFKGYKANRSAKSEDRWDKEMDKIVKKIITSEPSIGNQATQLAIDYLDLKTKYLKLQEKKLAKHKNWEKIIHETLENYSGVIGLTTVESDDAVSIMYYKHKDTYDITISHIDKDINCVPGKHQNYKDNSTYEISKDEAEIIFKAQVLSGDHGDGLPGIEGVGPTTAKKYVTENESVASAYGRAATRNYFRDYHCIRLLKDLSELNKLGKFKEVDIDIIEDFNYNNEDFD